MIGDGFRSEKATYRLLKDRGMANISAPNIHEYKSLDCEQWQMQACPQNAFHNSHGVSLRAPQCVLVD
jgi:hypothetical protein